MKKGLLWLLAALIPLLFILVSPSFGITNSISLFVFIVFMFLVHLALMRGYKGHKREPDLSKKIQESLK